MATPTVSDQIAEFNTGRDPDRLALKLKAIRESPFVFLRGTCRLFYQNLPKDALLTTAPHTWLCGDMHLQNMGTYKGDDHVIYFDINDFDEAALGPCTWDLLRLLTSIILGTQALKLGEIDIISLCQACANSYVAALGQGKARRVEKALVGGMVEDLIDITTNRPRKAFLDSRTEIVEGQRRIRIDGKKASKVTDAQREQVTQFMTAFSKQQPAPQSEFFKLVDVARRIAGTGSLGVDRYILLVEGKGSPDDNFLLDLKQAVPTSLLPALSVVQPEWSSEAERVVTVQRWMQAVSQAFLRPVIMGESSYVFRSLQPNEDRIDVADWQGKLHRLQDAFSTMGLVLAWAHLRSAGRQGSVSVDELIAFAVTAGLADRMIQLSAECAKQVVSDWTNYCQGN